VGSRLNQLSAFHDQNAIGAADRGQAVRDNQNRTISGNPF
jgi:hypothetical protein